MDPSDQTRSPHHPQISRSDLPPPPPPPSQVTFDLLEDEDGQGLPLDSSMINSSIMGFDVPTAPATTNYQPSMRTPSPSPSPKAPSPIVSAAHDDDDNSPANLSTPSPVPSPKPPSPIAAHHDSPELLQETTVTKTETKMSDMDSDLDIFLQSLESKPAESVLETSRNEKSELASVVKPVESVDDHLSSVTSESKVESSEVAARAGANEATKVVVEESLLLGEKAAGASSIGAASLAAAPFAPPAPTTTAAADSFLCQSSLPEPQPANPGPQLNKEPLRRNTTHTSASMSTESTASVSSSSCSCPFALGKCSTSPVHSWIQVDHVSLVVKRGTLSHVLIYLILSLFLSLVLLA